MKKIWAIGIIAVVVLVGIGLAMAGSENIGERGQSGVHGPPDQTDEKGDPPTIATTDVSAVASGGIIIQSGRAGPWTVTPSGTYGASQWHRITFPKAFSTRPRVVWTAEISPYSGKIDYGIDYGWIGTTYFDSRVTNSDSRSVTYYVNWIACGV